MTGSMQFCTRTDTVGVKDQKSLGKKVVVTTLSPLSPVKENHLTQSVIASQTTRNGS